MQGQLDEISTLLGERNRQEGTNEVGEQLRMELPSPIREDPNQLSLQFSSDSEPQN